MAYSLPLVADDASSVVRKRFDVLAIGYFLTPVEVGLYNAALPLALMLRTFLVAVNRITLPVASELLGQGRLKELSEVYKVGARWSLTFTLPAFLVLAFFPAQVLELVFGPDYIVGAASLRIIACGIFIFSISGSFQEFLMSYGKSTLVLTVVLTGTLINLGLILLLVPTHGLIGAAAASAASYMGMAVTGVAFVMRQGGMQPVSMRYGKSLAFGILLFAALYILGLSADMMRNPFEIVVLLVLFGTGYAWTVVRYFTDEFDKQLLRSAWQKVYATVGGRAAS